MEVKPKKGCLILCIFIFSIAWYIEKTEMWLMVGGYWLDKIQKKNAYICMYTNILATISSIFSQYITYLLCTSSIKMYSLVGLCFVVIRHLIEQFGGGRSQVNLNFFILYIYIYITGHFIRCSQSSFFIIANCCASRQRR